MPDLHHPAPCAYIVTRVEITVAMKIKNRKKWHGPLSDQQWGMWEHCWTSNDSKPTGVQYGMGKNWMKIKSTNTKVKNFRSAKHNRRLALSYFPRLASPPLGDPDEEWPSPVPQPISAHRSRNCENPAFFFFFFSPLLFLTWPTYGHSQSMYLVLYKEKGPIVTAKY